ncbi:MAG: phosphocholine cytidylyltransferase family protein [Mesorhizobium sp.]|uniref:MobA-like NTP transferase domain-containing protein n=2 Tax=Phyllobacteriaceae TaxID=69277 RepID=A0AB36R1K7_9HYPH|nr:hypothetical protein CIT25_30150 [Mesorhizobium mediterraneum]RWK45040.1 MAG: phosphocholine cytidylyltransferase family protein [Mesorhizobium sp.]RWN24646.1 MAG: phosphocholine cytidylyltransferase family protein [Mesorhizobium sp.]RWN32520.1 MAG: phosphocholine cytidylyltransferase family protein [Mesorhizobium sp.]TIP39562.1 MAG: phosphocholine cytidylyltransferase family protein [Mesorhizobium sp.]
MTIQRPSRPMTRSAVVLAAGLGRRLGELTRSIPKALLPVNGIPILVNTLRCLADAGVTDVTIVIGHLGEMIKQQIGKTFYSLHIRYVDAPLFESTNNLVSLWNARALLDRPSFILDGDVFFDKDVIFKCLNSPHPNIVAVDRYIPGMTGTVVISDASQRITQIKLIRGDECAAAPKPPFQKTLSIQRFSSDFLQGHLLSSMSEAIDRGDLSMFYEEALRDLIAKTADDVHAVACHGSRWIEIDDLQDYGRAQVYFSTFAATHQATGPEDSDSGRKKKGAGT